MKGLELVRVIESVGKDRGIKREIIVAALEQAMLSAAQKRFGPSALLESHFNEETGEIEVFLFKKVVESDDSMLEPNEEIKVEDARAYDPDCQIGDEIGVKVETDFGRIDAQTAKQVIFQKVRDAEREVIFNEYIHRKGEIISGIARRVERGNLVIDLGKTDAFLPRGEIIPGEQFKPGDRVQAILLDVLSTSRGPQLRLSRTSPEYLIKLFEIEVPEIRESIVSVKLCVREPGARAKIAVTSRDRDVDPIGACVGMKGVRVQNVIQEVRGEKIDIIPWSENPVMFVRSALQPAEISSVNVDEGGRRMEIMVEDNQLSLAIGKKGQNVRLAAQLTGWRLDIVSKTKLQQRTTEATFNLQHIPGINETLAQALFQTGFASVRDVADAKVSALQAVPGFEEEAKAEQLKQGAQSVVEKAGDLLAKPSIQISKGPNGASNSEKGAFSAEPSPQNSDAKSQAEQRLREMMQQSSEKDKESESGEKPVT